MKNLYDILDIKKNASKEEIKKAHRNGVKKNHPDKGGDPEEFRAVQLAYDVLSDDVKRERYDTTGETEAQRDPFMERFVHFVEEVLLPQIEKDEYNAIDVISYGKKVLNDTAREAEDNIKELNKKVERITKKLDKVKKKSAGVNLITTLLNEKIKQYNSRIDTQKMMVEFSNKALEEIDDYEYEFDPNAKPQDDRPQWFTDMVSNIRNNNGGNSL
jgi:curved DNA-binding protein CbpA